MDCAHTTFDIFLVVAVSDSLFLQSSKCNISLASTCECVHLQLQYSLCLIMATRSLNITVSWSSCPSSHYYHSFLKDCPRCNAPLAVCVSAVRACMCVCMFPREFSYCRTACPLSNSIFDPSLKPRNLVSPVCPQQQQAWWHSRWQWPQERRVHPQQQSTLPPYRHRPLDEAICRGHLREDDIISSQSIEVS